MFIRAFKSQPKLSLLMVLLILVSVSFRLIKLDHLPAINGDEVYTTVQMFELSHGKKVDLFLPTHRTLSPLYGGYVLLIENCLRGYNFWNVRAPAALAGILLIGFAGLFLYWAMGIPRAAIATLLIATLPMNIAYSRSAVEQCLVGLFSLFPLYFALEGSFFSAMAALVLAIVVHPLNIFLLPTLLLPLVSKFYIRSTWLQVRKMKFLCSVFLGMLGFIFLLLYALPEHLGTLNLLSVGRYLWDDPQNFSYEFLRFLHHFLRILSGISVYEYFAWAPPRWVNLSWDIGLGLLLSILFGIGLKHLYRKKQWRDFYFCLGFLFTLLCLFFVGGPKSLSVGLSRYGTFLTVPSAIVVALLLKALFPEKKTESKLLWATLWVSALFLYQFWCFYFGALKKTGGGYTHRTYISGPQEPKAQVFDWILSQNPAHERRLVIAEDWWIYWPLRYLALPYPEIQVIQVTKEMDSSQFDALFQKGVYAVGFPGGPIFNRLKESFASKHEGQLTTFKPVSYAKNFMLMAWRHNP